MKLPKYIQDAIVCGPVPVLRNWKALGYPHLTKGEQVLRFAHDHLVFPEGVKIGQPLALDRFQQAFILAAIDGDGTHHVSKALFSIARRNGKSLVLAVILLAFVVGPLKRRNTLVRSAAMSRDQAALIWRLMSLICDMSPDLEGMYRSVPSSKRIVGMAANVDFCALSRDAKTGHGQNIYALVVDECGQIDAPNDDFLDMLFSSQGSFDDARTFLISTQAPSDAAFFSVEIDTAERDQPKDVVCHVYRAETDDMKNRNNWRKANPGVRGGYRSLEDIARSSGEAIRIPAKQPGFLNLFMNRRVSRSNAFVAPAIWKENSGAPDLSIFQESGVHIGLDLSVRSDLTAAVLSAQDADDNIHLMTYGFLPENGLREKSLKDKAPFDVWAQDEKLHAVPGDVISYDYVAEFLRDELHRMEIPLLSIQFDKWKSVEFKAACERVGWAQDCQWDSVPQGFYGFSERLAAFEQYLLERKIRHGNHPILNLGAAHAVVVMDGSNNRRLMKNKSTQKIDALVSAIMAVYPWQLNDEVMDVDSWIG